MTPGQNPTNQNVNETNHIQLLANIQGVLEQDRQEIDVSNLNSGLYRIMIIEDNGPEVRSFIKY